MKNFSNLRNKNTLRVFHTHWMRNRKKMSETMRARFLKKLLSEARTKKLNIKLFFYGVILLRFDNTN